MQHGADGAALPKPYTVDQSVHNLPSRMDIGEVCDDIHFIHRNNWVTWPGYVGPDRSDRANKLQELDKSRAILEGIHGIFCTCLPGLPTDTSTWFVMMYHDVLYQYVVPSQSQQICRLEAAGFNKEVLQRPLTIAPHCGNTVLQCDETNGT